jgi:hypothetical protein
MLYALGLSQFQSVSYSHSFSTLRLELISSWVIIITLPTRWAKDMEAHVAEEEHTEEVDAVQTQDMVAQDIAAAGVEAVEAVMMMLGLWQEKPHCSRMLPNFFCELLNVTEFLSCQTFIASCRMLA